MSSCARGVTSRENEEIHAGKSVKEKLPSDSSKRDSVNLGEQSVSEVLQEAS